MEKRIITYEEYGSLLKKLVDKILYSTNPVMKRIKYVHGIPRGGLPIATHLAHHLELNYIDDADYYRDITLVVDDIADMGITLMGYNNPASATLFYKKRSEVEPTFYVEETDKWIVFPWERLDEIPNRD